MGCSSGDLGTFSSPPIRCISQSIADRHLSSCRHVAHPLPDLRRRVRRCRRGLLVLHLLNPSLLTVTYIRLFPTSTFPWSLYLPCNLPCIDSPRVHCSSPPPVSTTHISCVYCSSSLLHPVHLSFFTPLLRSYQGWVFILAALFHCFSMFRLLEGAERFVRLAITTTSYHKRASWRCLCYSYIITHIDGPGCSAPPGFCLLNRNGPLRRCCVFTTLFEFGLA